MSETPNENPSGRPDETTSERAGEPIGDVGGDGYEFEPEAAHRPPPIPERSNPEQPIPEHLRPSAPPTTPGGLPSGRVRDGAMCVSCGYELAGLAPSGACPECGTPIARSLRGDLLAFAPPEYLAKLHRGATIVVVTILVMVVFFVAGIGVTAYVLMSGPAAGAGALPALVEGVLGLGGLALGLLLLYGWWLLSTPMPSPTHRHESTRMDTARRWVRGLLIASAALSVVQFVVDLAIGAPAGSATPTTPTGAVLIGGLGLLSALVGVAGYVMQMLYVAWLGQRIPDQDIYRRGKRNAWLVPVLATVGAIIVVGPLIALIMYWNLVDALRKQLKHLRENQERYAS